MLPSTLRPAARAYRFIAAFCLALALAQPSALGQEPSTLTLTCLEIKDIQRGAGLAVVIQTPGGKTYLYDTGNGYPTADGKGWAGDYNAGRDTIKPFLNSKRIDRLDGVLISHAHFDHFGGLLWLAEHATIGRLIDSGYHFAGSSSADYGRELDSYDQLRARFRSRPGAYLAAHAGDRLALDDRLDVEVLAPPKTYFDEPHPERRPKKDPPAHYLVNANSLGVRIQHGDVVFLLPGDIQAEDQVRSLLPSVAPEKLRCTVLVAPGHGIHSVPEFAAATRPEITLVSAPPRYARTSPAKKVYAKVGSKVYLTGVHGRLTVVSDGKSVKAEVERPGEK
jgi:competence protein ComEC